MQASCFNTKASPYFKDIFEHDWDNLAQRDMGGSFQSAWSTNEAALEGDAAITSVLLSPKHYPTLIGRRMTPRHRAQILASTLLAAASCTRGAEIVLEQTAVQKLIEQSLFNDSGRYYVHRGACAAYLEYPTVSLRDGRVVIRSHMSGRFGVELGNNCLGVGLASWSVVSGTPSAQGAVVRLTGIRLDDVQDSNARRLLNSGLVPSLPKGIELDVLKSVRTMLQDAGGQIQADVQRLDIQSVSAADNKLSIRFDFKLIGR